MTKSTTMYWNALSPENRQQWHPIPGLEDIAEEITLSIDLASGEYTRLTRFHPGAPAYWGAKAMLIRKKFSW